MSNSFDDPVSRLLLAHVYRVCCAARRRRREQAHRERPRWKASRCSVRDASTVADNCARPAVMLLHTLCAGRNYCTTSPRSFVQWWLAQRRRTTTRSVAAAASARARGGTAGTGVCWWADFQGTLGSIACTQWRRREAKSEWSTRWGATDDGDMSAMQKERRKKEETTEMMRKPGSVMRDEKRATERHEVGAKEKERRQQR